MAVPKIRFRREDGTEYPEWESIQFGKLYQKVIEKNDLSFGKDRIISVANMYFKDPDDRDSQDDEYMKTYNVMRLGDIAFEGNKSKKYAHGRFVENTIGDGIVSHVFDVFRPLNLMNLTYWKEYINYEPIMGKVLVKCTKSSTMMTNLVSEDFLSQRIFVPCDEEQQKIADFLSSVDEVIDANEQEVANLETQKKAVMKKIFSQEVRFKRTDGSIFPEWEELALNDISERIIVGLATTVTPYYRENGVPMFRNLNIRAGYLDDSNILYLDEGYASKQGGKFIHAGDILTVHTGNIGWSCVVPDCYEGALSFTTLITTLKNNGVTNDYVCAYLNSDLGMKQMLDLAFSGGRANLNTSEFQKVIVPIPSLEEQRLIADFLSNFDETISAAKKELELWKELKKGLLQQMFV